MGEIKPISVPEITAFFAVRPGEVLHFSQTMQDQGDCYAVMLVETPSFPGDGHIESAALSVVCAAPYNTETGASGNASRWGWVHIEAATKELLGNALEHIGAIPGVWYFMYVSGGVGHRPRTHFTEGG